MLVALAAVVFLVPQASAAQKVPTLVSTPQYKALVQYVAKLRDLRDTPTTAARKTVFEETLTDRHRSAVNKSTALFKRSREVAKAQTQAGFKADSKKVRAAEATALAALRDEYVDRFQRAEDSFQANVDALERVYDDANAKINKKIAKLRMRKAKTKGAIEKAQIQDRIEALKEDLAENRVEEREARKRLRVRFVKEREAIRAAKAKDTAAIEDDSQKKIETIKRRWDRVFNRKLGNLQNRRSNQVSDLENKLEAGRGYIAQMPTTE
jgi:DNA anti-recombination protein RmuC